MKNRLSVFLLLALLLLPGWLAAQKKEPPRSFSFVFITDIHLEPELNAPEGFRKAISAVNKERPAFVMTGGDLVYDAMGRRYPRADSLFTLYKRLSSGFKAPVYNTIGNHEHFAVYRESGPDTLNPMAGTKLYEDRIGSPYYTFMYKGWKFFSLNSARMGPNRRYTGGIDSVQMQWIRQELAATDSSTPIVIVTHIPLVTVENQLLYGATRGNDPDAVIVNSKQVLDLFNHHNLKLVLQGHLHYFEEIYVKGVHFITGGSIAGAWWKGSFRGTPGGFLLVHAGKDEITWEYKTYGFPAVER